MCNIAKDKLESEADHILYILLITATVAQGMFDKT